MGFRGTDTCMGPLCMAAELLVVPSSCEAMTTHMFGLACGPSCFFLALAGGRWQAMFQESVSPARGSFSSGSWAQWSVRAVGLHVVVFSCLKFLQTVIVIAGNRASYPYTGRHVPKPDIFCWMRQGAASASRQLARWVDTQQASHCQAAACASAVAHQATARSLGAGSRATREWPLACLRPTMLGRSSSHVVEFGVLSTRATWLGRRPSRTT